LRETGVSKHRTRGKGSSSRGERTRKREKDGGNGWQTTKERLLYKTKIIQNERNTDGKAAGIWPEAGKAVKQTCSKKPLADKRIKGKFREGVNDARIAKG